MWAKHSPCSQPVASTAFQLAIAPAIGSTPGSAANAIVLPDYTISMGDDVTSKPETLLQSIGQRFAAGKLRAQYVTESIAILFRKRP